MTREEAIQMLRLYEANKDGEGELGTWYKGIDKDMREALDMATEALSADAVSREECDKCKTDKEGVLLQQLAELQDDYETMKNAYEYALADAAQEWIQCSERLPKVNQRVLLATTDGQVFVGYREKPDLVWQVTEKDGRKHWVYDPENYTDDIEILPKNEDCGFAKDDVYSDGFLSVTSVNYDDRFEGVTAWMPLPKPYREDGVVGNVLYVINGVVKHTDSAQTAER